MTRTAEAEKLAAQFRMLKARADVSFETLAKRAGISSSTLHRYCSGVKTPSDPAAIRAFAKACGATTEEFHELHRLWVLADAARSTAGDIAPEAVPDADLEPESEPSTPAPSFTARLGRFVRRPLVIATAAAVVTATATAVVFLSMGEGEDPEPGATVLAQVRVYNVEGDCKTRPERVPACSMGLARDPHRKYDADNVVSHRVWHADVLHTDCVLYGGDRVEDETGVGTTRWFRVRLNTVPGGIAWLPAVRTHDNPPLPTCA
ncbi:helix-turn-helix domain-containing protein [Acrocarpospora phusangensis]|nr:helix-turn-helix transcriptional regulator [Acrocarpospora phusangensis]